MKNEVRYKSHSCHFVKRLLLLTVILFCQLIALADSSLQQVLDNLSPSSSVTEINLSQYTSTLTETLFIRGGINVRFVNGTLKRDESATGRPLVEIMENSRLELASNALLTGYRSQFGSSSNAITLLSSGELVIKGGEIDGSLGNAFWGMAGSLYYIPMASSVAVSSQSEASLILESGTLTGGVSITSPSGASFIIKSGTLTGDVVNKGYNDVRIYGGTVKGTVSTQQTDILIGGEANIDQINLENSSRVGIMSPVNHDITIKDVASGEAAVYGYGYQLTSSDIANIWFMDDYKPQLSGNTVIATEWGSERYIWQSNPGHLAYMSERNQEITNVLFVSGSVNGEDIAMICKLGKKALKTLDLSHANMVDGGSYYSIYHPGYPGYNEYFFAKKDTICYHMFANMTTIEKISMPSGIRVIEDEAFANCENLKIIVPYSDFMEIGGSAFNGCTSLTDFNLNYNNYLVNESGIIYDKEKTKVHATLPAIVSGACVLPSTIKRINNKAFRGCKSLTSINLYALAIDAIEELTFGGCTELCEMQLPKNVANIKDSAFISCSLTKLVLPESLTEIGYGVFAKNPITEIHCKSIVPPIIQPFGVQRFWSGSSRFGSFEEVDTLTCKVYVPAGSVEAYKSTPGWSSFQNFMEDSPDSGHISTVDDLQAKLDEIAAKGVMTFETIELPEEGVLVNKPLYVRNGCRAMLTGGPLRLSPNTNGHYCVMIDDKSFLFLGNITIDMMNNDFHINSGIFYNMGDFRISSPYYTQGVQFINVPTSKGQYGECLFYSGAGSRMIYDNPGLLDAGNVSVIKAGDMADVSIYRGDLQSSYTPTIDGLGRVLLRTTIYGGGKGVSIINARELRAFEMMNYTINDVEGGATYVSADNLEICFSSIFDGYGNNIVVGKHASIMRDTSFPTIYLKKDAYITANVQGEWTLDGEWNAFTLGKTVIENVTNRSSFENITFLNMPDDREAYYDEAGQRVYLRLKTEEAYTVYTDDGTLTFYYDTQRNSREGTTYDLNTGYETPGWYADHRKDIVKAVFTNSFANARPTSTYRWFAVSYSFEIGNLSEIVGIDNLNTSEVTNMSEMFYDCRYLKSLDVSYFNTGNVTDMRAMFYYCSSLTSLDVSRFETSNVVDMGGMFCGCKGLTNLDVLHFETSKVTNMGNMFADCGSLTILDVSHFNTSNVTDMQSMFSYCSNLSSLNVSNLNTSNVTNMRDLFYNCNSLMNLDVSHFNTSKVTNMKNMFCCCSGLTSLDLSLFSTSNVTDMSGLFNQCKGLLTIYAGDGWNTRKVTKSEYMFLNCPNLVGGAGTKYDNSHLDVAYAHIDGGMSNPGYFTDKNAPHVEEAYAVYTDDGMLTFYYDMQRNSREGTTYSLNTGTNYPDWHTDHRKEIKKVVFNSSFSEARPTSTYSWFGVYNNYEESILSEIVGIEYLNTSLVTNMSCMFFRCVHLTGLDVSHFDTSKVEDMRYMFYECRSVASLDVGHFDTSKVTDMTCMFYNCRSITSLDVSHFDTSMVTSMYCMFLGCHSLTNLDLSFFDTQRVTNMYAMFNGCNNLTSLNISHFDTSNVITMSIMFAHCYGLKNLDISYFDTSNVIGMESMFTTCTALATIYVGKGWNTDKVTKSQGMFLNCPNLVGGAGTKYDVNHVDATYAHIDGGTSNPGYFTDIREMQGIDEITSEEPTVVDTYDALGRKATNISPAMNLRLQRMSDGSVRKIMMK